MCVVPAVSYSRPSVLRRSPGLAARLVCLCTLLAPAFAARAQTHENWSYNRAVYEVNVRQCTPEGPFSAFGAHLERLRSLGVEQPRRWQHRDPLCLWWFTVD